jgi:hypothetical protein
MKVLAMSLCALLIASHAKATAEAASLLHRFMQQQDQGDDDQTSSCPQDSIYHCNNPALVPTDDETVRCDEDSCRWILGALDENEPPKLCQGITIDKEGASDISGKSKESEMGVKERVKWKRNGGENEEKQRGTVHIRCTCRQYSISSPLFLLLLTVYPFTFLLLLSNN